MDFAASTAILSPCPRQGIPTIQSVLKSSRLPTRMEVLTTPLRHHACTCSVAALQEIT